MITVASYAAWRQALARKRVAYWLRRERHAERQLRNSYERLVDLEDEVAA